MRILFDLIGAQTDSRRRGIGRYTRALALEMLRQRGDDELAFALSANFAEAANDLRRDIGRIAPQTRFATYATPHSARYAAPRSDPARRLGETIIRRVVTGADPDAYFVSSVFEAWPPDFALPDFARLPTRLGVVLVHDFIPAIFPDLYLRDRTTARFFAEQMKATASADLLLANSDCTRLDTIRLLGVEPSRVVTISAAAEPIFRPMAPGDGDDEIRQRLGVRAPFVFCASGDDPRKNVAAAIDAFASLDRRDRDARQLVLLTPLDQDHERRLRARARKAGLQDHELVILRRVDDSDLVFLYSHCELFFFPSLYEGFGLPVLEAMQCGAPVLVGDNSSLREIVDRADLRCDTASPRATATAMAALLRDQARLAESSAWGLARAKDFSWEKTAVRALDAIRDAWRRPPAVARARPLPASLLLTDGLEAEAAEILKSAPASLSANTAADCILASCPDLYNGVRRRLLVDVTTIVAKDDRTGIQRVVRNVVKALYLDSDPGAVTPVAVRLRNGALVSCESYMAVLTGVAQTVPEAEIEIAPGDRLLMLDNSWADFERFAGVFAQVRAAGGMVVSCIYDLIPQLYKGASIGRVPEIHLAWLKAALVESDGVIAISRTVAEELCDYIAQRALATRPGLRIGWFHCGSDLAPAGNGRATQPMREAMASSAPTFLLVGTIEPRKGHTIALAAFEALWRAGGDAHLMLIGRRGWHVEALIEDIESHAEFGRRLFWFEDADDSDLACAYDNCAAVLAPSYAEGFGLPLAEAAWKGKPVICSDIPVFREIGGRGALYFRVNDSAALAAVLDDFIAGRATGDAALIIKPTWREAAARIVEVVMRDDWMRALT